MLSCTLYTAEFPWRCWINDFIKLSQLSVIFWHRPHICGNVMSRVPGSHDDGLWTKCKSQSQGNNHPAVSPTFVMMRIPWTHILVSAPSYVPPKCHQAIALFCLFFVYISLPTSVPTPASIIFLLSLPLTHKSQSGLFLIRQNTRQILQNIHAGVWEVWKFKIKSIFFVSTILIHPNQILFLLKVIEIF